jgi:beta-galactosidase
LVWPDRTPHPAAFELKHLQAPLAVDLAAAAAAADSSGGDGERGAALKQCDPSEEAAVVLRNKQHFADSTDLALSWRLLADGQPVAAGGKGGGGSGDCWQAVVLPAPLGPQEAAAAGLGLSWGEVAQRAQHAAEAALEVRAVLARDLPWAAAGHEVQAVQLPLAGLLPPPAGQPTSNGDAARPTLQPPPTVQQDGDGVTVAGAAGWRLRFDKASGALTGWQAADGGQLLAAPLAACLYRASTDNDRGGSGGSSYTARWKAAGLDRLEVQPGSVTISVSSQADLQDCAGGSEGSRGVQVCCAFTLRPGEQREEEAAVEEGVGVGEVRHSLERSFVLFTCCALSPPCVLFP